MTSTHVQEVNSISHSISPHHHHQICKFITLDPIPQLKASVSINNEWLISSLIQKIQSIIISETSNLDFVHSISLTSPTHRLILEQDGTRLPSDELCSIIDRGDIICVRMIPIPGIIIRDLLPRPPISTSTPINPSNQFSRLIPNRSTSLNDRLIYASLPQLSSNLPSPSKPIQEKSLIPKLEDLSDIPFARSHIEPFRKSAARHYELSSDSSNHSSNGSQTYTEDEDQDFKPKKKTRFNQFSEKSTKQQKSLRSSSKKSSKGTQRELSDSMSPEVFQTLTNSGEKKNKTQYDSFICVEIPYVKIKNTELSKPIKIQTPIASTSYLNPRMNSLSSSSKKLSINSNIRSSKRSIYEIHIIDLTFKAASSQGPLRIPSSNQGINSNSTILELSKYLKLEKHQSWKIKIDHQLWINHHDDRDHSRIELSSFGNTNRRSSNHSTMIMKDWDLSLDDLGVSPQKEFPKIEVIRNWDK